jgi:hypothetical protein
MAEILEMNVVAYWDVRSAETKRVNYGNTKAEQLVRKLD